jgi:4-amino-4-deoxy-L-arabinose transferase-like glycosyltransferase
MYRKLYSLNLRALRNHIPFIAFFSLLTLIGLFNFKKYGISWEAPGLRLNGGNALVYIADLFHLNVVPEYYRNFPAMGMNGMADHGVAYDAPLGALEVLLGIKEPMHIYQMRTLVNFIVFTIGTLSIYFIVKRRLTSKKLAILACVFYVLSPRIFSAGFYSPADMPFTSFFVLGVNLSLRFLEKPLLINAFLAGLVCGYATDIRLLGIVIFPIITFLFFVKYYSALPKREVKISPILTYLTAGVLSIYAFFPYLWASPIKRFLEVFSSLSNYPWGGMNLYFGKLIPANDLPWHYIPTWILITTPLLYIFLFIIGGFSIFAQSIRKKVIDFDLIQDTLFLMLVFFPILTVIILNSVLYDTWRHLYFVYPFLIVVSVIGWNRIAPKESFFGLFKAKVILTTILVFQIATWMVVNNPHQYLYFNSLAGNISLEKKWEMDYLGLSNKEGLQYLLSRNPNRVVTVGVVSFTPFDMSLKSLPSKYNDRISVVSLKEQPDYIVNNFRMISKEFTGSQDYAILKTFKVDNSRYLEIWERKK